MGPAAGARECRAALAGSLGDRLNPVAVVVAVHSLLDGIPEEEAAAILGGLERRRFPPAAVVVAEGDAHHGILLVESGTAEVLIADRHGVERLIGHVHEGDSIGEMGLFTGRAASTTVRAVTELDVVVLGDGDFMRLAARFPVVHRNLDVLLSERLARTSRVAAERELGRVSVLEDLGAPPLLGYALASSIAWHSRSPTLLLVLDDEPADELRALARELGEGEQERRATVVLARGDELTAGALDLALEELAPRFEHVLIQTRRPLEGLDDARRLALLGAAGRPPRGVGTALRAWASPPRRLGPDTGGIVPVPQLAAADEDLLAHGLLPGLSDAGRSLGWAARDLAGLKVGLALGSGSIRGWAHVGVVRTLLRAKVPVDYVAGTSIGAAVAGLFAMGKEPDEIADILEACGNVMIRPTIPVSSLLSSRALAAFISGTGGGRRIEDLPLPLGIVTADVHSGREVVLRRGDVATAVTASIAIPGIYPPVRVGPYSLVDGGIVDPVPTHAVTEMGADKVIAVRLAAPGVDPDTDAVVVEGHGPQPSVVAVLMRSLELMQERMLPAEGPRAIFVTPAFAGLPAGKLRKFGDGRRYIEVGEAACEEALHRIATALPWVRG